MNARQMTRIWLAISVFSFPLSAFSQGSLTPPGAPAPTMKTLDQVEARIPVDATHAPGNATTLFILSQPGSYYLTSNLAGVSGQHGITINADNITLDLNGFVLVGPGNSNGIDCAGHKDVVIRNGTIRGWATGVSSQATAKELRMEKIRFISNSSGGITIAGNSVIAGCMFESTGIGITTGPNCVISGCYFTLNGLGIMAGTGNVITGCELFSQTGTGIIANSRCLIKDCRISGNSAKGIDTITSGGTNAGTIIENSTFELNIGFAIDLSGSCIVRDCRIAPNSVTDGINLAAGVSNASIVNNQIRNAAAGHAGINCAGSANRIDSNTFSGNNIALLTGAGSSNNVITRNIFLGNTTNFTNSGGGQKDAQILNFGSAQVSTDPWANIR